MPQFLRISWGDEKGDEKGDASPGNPYIVFHCLETIFRHPHIQKVQYSKHIYAFSRYAFSIGDYYYYACSVFRAAHYSQAARVDVCLSVPWRIMRTDNES